jgi:hypothetical protein
MKGIFLDLACEISSIKKSILRRDDAAAISGNKLFFVKILILDCLIIAFTFFDLKKPSVKRV